MVFKKFRIVILLSILFIIALAFGLVYFALLTPYWLVSFWLALLIIITTVFLIRYIERWQNRLSNFLSSINYNDFTGSYSKDGKNDSLGMAFSNILDVFKKLRNEKEINHLYLQTIVEHINTALICLDENENIVIANRPAQKLFNRKSFKSIKVVKQFDEDLYQSIKKLKGGQKSLVKLRKGEQSFNIAIHAAEFSLLDQAYKLISFQDIKAELEEQELDSWKKLVRVLTHEIMNTSIPISTLASVINQMLVDEKGNVKPLSDLNQEEEEDLKLSLKTIEKRSKGIVDFVRVTKSYTSVTTPKFREVSINELIDHVLDLHKPEINKNNIEILWEKNKLDFKYKIDLKLIEQVLINVLRNSIEAVADINKPRIEIILRTNLNEGFKIQIIDNGCGMSDEILDNLFVPFFTTKKEGSGIGLSLSKQIMKLHNANIYAVSEEGKGSTIELSF